MQLSSLLTRDGPDRIRRPRLRLAYSFVSLNLGDASRSKMKTEDLSCKGFSFVIDRIFTPRETVECKLVFPSEHQAGPPATTPRQIVRLWRRAYNFGAAVPAQEIDSWQNR
jgi:hypothetical protein